MQRQCYTLLFASLLCTISLHADLNKDLAAKSESSVPTVPQLQVALTFDTKSIQLHPQYKNDFIAFAHNNLDSQDPAIIGSIVYLTQRYPHECKQAFAARNDLNPRIQAIFDAQDAEGKKTKLQKMLDAATPISIFICGIQMMNILGQWNDLFIKPYGKNTGQLMLHKDGDGQVMRDKNGEAIPDWWHKDAEWRLNYDGFTFRPAEQYPRLFLSMYITAKMVNKIQNRAIQNWGYRYVIPHHDEKGLQSERYASIAVEKLMWLGVQNFLNAWVVNPALSKVLP